MIWYQGGVSPKYGFFKEGWTLRFSPNLNLQLLSALNEGRNNKHLPVKECSSSLHLSSAQPLPLYPPSTCLSLFAISVPSRSLLQREYSNRLTPVTRFFHMFCPQHIIFFSLSFLLSFLADVATIVHRTLLSTPLLSLRMHNSLELPVYPRVSTLFLYLRFISILY